MNYALELHDSRVESLRTNRADLTVQFSAAYLHKSEGVPGADAGSGWVQEAELIFVGANYGPSIDIGDGWIVEGSVCVGGELMSVLPVPFTAADSVAAHLCFANGSTLKVHATSVCLSLTGKPRYVEDFPGV